MALPTIPGAARRWTSSPWKRPRRVRIHQALIETRKGVAADVPASSFNLIGGHDTERIRTLCQNDPLRHGQIVLFQLTYPGVPSIYYGDEIGIEGGADPDNRRVMPWKENQWDRGQRDFYKKVISARQNHSALQDGNFEVLVVDDDRAVYGFVRYNEAERVLLLFNRGIEPTTVSLPVEKVGTAPLQDWLEIGIEFKQEAGQTQVTLPPRGLALLGSVLQTGKNQENIPS